MVVASALDGPIRKIDRLVRFIGDELQSSAPLPWPARLASLAQGFNSISTQLYRMTPANRRLYVSDYQRMVLTPDINGGYRVLLKDKLLFNLTTQIFPDLHIPAHGVIDRGQVSYARHGGAEDPVRYVADLLTRGRLVLKPLFGGGGRQISFLAREGNGYSINERRRDPAGFAEWLRGLHRNLISDFIPQHPALAALYPRTTNTIRLLTMWDLDRSQPFLAAAVLRIGNSRSYPVDNSMAGGLASAIDVETGRATRAVSVPSRGAPMAWHSAHPETGAEIENLAIPHWPAIVDTILKVCRRLPYLPYVGWDVIVTEDGLKLVEGNHFPGLFPHQTHAPLLADQRVRRFYAAHGIS